MANSNLIEKKYINSLKGHCCLLACTAVMRCGHANEYAEDETGQENMKQLGKTWSYKTSIQLSNKGKV